MQVIQWFVSEGAHVEEWSPLLEVQSDKAADTITSRFPGIVKKLYAKQDDTIKTGSALCDIDVVGEEESEQKIDAEQGETSMEEIKGTISPAPSEETDITSHSNASIPSTKPGKHAALATPAVRGLLKQHNLDILDVRGTGRDGRVLKEDIYNHISSKDASTYSITSSHATSVLQTETPQKLTALQLGMFRSMTASLQIPHFLYTEDVNLTSLSTLRKTLNRDSSPAEKLTFLPFIVKSLSLTLQHHPLLNSRLTLPTSPSDKPSLIQRSSHNIGIAIDTPSGLLVPVIKAVETLTTRDIASEIQRLTNLARNNKLSTSDLTGGTITISNVGNLGRGGVVSPVIVEGQVAILGVGRAKTVPVFENEDDENDVRIKRAEMVTLSWCADHRVVDGGSLTRAAGMVRQFLEMPGRMVVCMR